MPVILTMKKLYKRIRDFSTACLQFNLFALIPETGDSKKKYAVFYLTIIAYVVAGLALFPLLLLLFILKRDDHADWP
jgi:hypothetical protein